MDIRGDHSIHCYLGNIKRRIKIAIRIRKVNGKTIALCAAKTNEKPNDLYLDDTIHHALSTKFGLDFYKEGLLDNPLADNELVPLMEKEIGGL